MKKIILAALYTFSLLNGMVANADLKETDSQYVRPRNYVQNAGFENGLGKWTASGGSFTQAISGSNLLVGAGSGVWDSSAANQTLSSTAFTVPNSLKGLPGEFSCTILTPSGTATHLLQAWDGSSAIGSQTVLSSTSPKRTRVPIMFPTSGTIQLRLKAVNANEPAISIDNCSASIWEPSLTMTTTERDALTSPSAGIIIFNSTTALFNFYDGSAWAALPTSADAYDTPDRLQNATLATSVSANALTISLKDSAGATPSAGSPVIINYRDATAATGTYTKVTTTGAVSVVVSSGSTLGCVSATACVLYVYAIYSGSATVLGVVSGSSVDEGTVFTTTAEGGAGASDTAGVMYTTAAQTSRPIRLIGRVTITEATAGTWASNATEISGIPFSKRGAGTRFVTTTDSATISDDHLMLSGASFTETIYTPVGNLGKVIKLTHGGTSLSQVYTLNLAAGNIIGPGSTTVTSGNYKLQTAGEYLELVSNNVDWVVKVHLTATPEADAGALVYSASSAHSFTIVSASITAGTTYSTPNGCIFVVSTTSVASVTLLAYGTCAPNAAANTLTYVSGPTAGNRAYSAVSNAGQPVKPTVTYERFIWTRDGSYINYRYEYAWSGAVGAAGTGDIAIWLPTTLPPDETNMTEQTAVLGAAYPTSMSILGHGFGHLSAVPFDVYLHLAWPGMLKGICQGGGTLSAGACNPLTANGRASYNGRYRVTGFQP